LIYAFNFSSDRWGLGVITLVKSKLNFYCSQGDCLLWVGGLNVAMLLIYARINFVAMMYCVLTVATGDHLECWHAIDMLVYPMMNLS
jgi:hypothetical protein